MLIYLHQVLGLKKNSCLVFFQVILSPMLNFQFEAFFFLSSKHISSLDIKYVIPVSSALLTKVMHFGVAYKFDKSLL
jgi:hypothetical protein